MSFQHIYMDYHATTPTDPRVVKVMEPWWSVDFGNPHSGDHWFGWTAHQAIEDARSRLADMICSEQDEVIFTSGATESNNLAILGAAKARRAERPHVIVSAIEHKCILESASELKRNGFDVDVVSVLPDGRVSLDDIRRLVTNRTGLVSIMAVNNEIGTIQPLTEIGHLCRSVGAWFHSDAAQAPAAINLDVYSQNVDLLSLSSHKMYGPMGIGALYIRSDIMTEIQPTTFGGGQEMGLRSGTVPTPLAVGFGEAAYLMIDTRENERKRIDKLRDRLWQGISKKSPSAFLNGSTQERHPGNLSVTFPNVDASALIGALQPHLAISTGSACTSGIIEPSHVLVAIGLSIEDAESSVRFGIGRFTTSEDVDGALELLSAATKEIEKAVA